MRKGRACAHAQRASVRACAKGERAVLRKERACAHAQRATVRACCAKGIAHERVRAYAQRTCARRMRAKCERVPVICEGFGDTSF
eukprot:1707437-Pleurochrysis_carterae.AAC.1